MIGLFKDKAKEISTEYTEAQSAEAHRIKDEIQKVLSQSGEAMRKRRLQINKEFDKLETSLLDASKAIAIATGGRKRGLKI